MINSNPTSEELKDAKVVSTRRRSTDEEFTVDNISKYDITDKFKDVMLTKNEK